MEKALAIFMASAFLFIFLGSICHQDLTPMKVVKSEETDKSNDGVGAAEAFFIMSVASPY